MKMRATWVLFVDTLVEAAMSMRDYRLRTLLSVMGIAIGIAAVILIGTVSKGGRYFIFNELQTFGLRSVWVFRDQKITDPRRAEVVGTGIDADDLGAISANMCCNGLQQVTPVVYGSRDSSGGRLLARSGAHYTTPKVEGVGLAYMKINNDELAAGRGFKEQDIERRRAVAVIGSQVRADLFGDSGTVVGKEIRLGERTLEVIGVLEAKDRSFLASIGSGGGQDVNARILLPYTSALQILGRTDLDVLQGTAAESSDPQQVAAQIATAMHRRHGDRFDYKGESMARYVETADRILMGVSLIGLVAAAVSLFVAGLGILNIMSTSVLERTREIGIRKAVGGSESAILLQFLLEAALVSAYGGVVGLVLGSVASAVLAAATGFPLVPSMPTVAIAFLVSIAVGVLSGLVPAYRASRLQPVQALRYE
jgi:putative ABC transport system permease protein